FAHQRYRGLHGGRNEGLQYEGHGVAQRAAQRQDRTGLPDSRFLGPGVGQRFHAQTARGRAGGAAGPLPGRYCALQPGLRGDRHVSLRRSRPIEEHRAGRYRAHAGAKACRGIAEKLSDAARVGDGTQLDGEELMPRIRKEMWSRMLHRSIILILAAPCWAASANFNIVDYGAKNDGSAPATEAFRRAIQAAKAAGGGTVYVPAGKYVTGPIELISNLVLYFDAGAVVQFPAQRLPFTKSRQQSIEAITPVPLIGGSNLENVTIAGRGLLMSNNDDWMKLMPRQKATGSDPGSANGPNWERLLQLLEVKTPAPEEAYQAAAGELRPSFIRTMDSRNVLIEGLQFVGSPMWTIHLLYSDNVVVRDVIIETYPGVHTDGIAVDSSRNVRISNCYIDTGDDGIVIKSGKDADGLRVNRPTENVSITNCTVRHPHGAVTIGSETSGWIRNLVASNITCDGTQMGVRIKSRRGRGGGVEDARFDNWTMRM